MRERLAGAGGGRAETGEAAMPWVIGLRSYVSNKEMDGGVVFR